jgi:hypothetical protein
MFWKFMSRCKMIKLICKHSLKKWNFFLNYVLLKICIQKNDVYEGYENQLLNLLF